MPSVWRRGAAVLIGLWFTLSVSGVALQLCPQHNHTHAAGAMHHADAAVAGAEVADAHDGGASPSGRQDHHSHDDCTCTGMCCVTAAVSLGAARLVTIPVVVAEAPVVVAPRTLELAPRAAADVTLPPPLGPPTLRT